MTIRLGTHLAPTIFSDAATLHVCKQQQIASGNELLFSDTLDSDLLTVLLMTIRLGTFHPPLPLILKHYMFVNNNK